MERTVTPITQTYRPAGIRREIDARSIGAAGPAFDASTLCAVLTDANMRADAFTLQTSRRTGRLKDTEGRGAMIFLRDEREVANT